MIQTATLESPLGSMTAAEKNGAVIGLWFEDQKHYPQNSKDWLANPNAEIFEQLQNWLAAYFSGQETASLPPLAPSGTEFQKKVWQKLLSIKKGETSTYGQIALALGNGGSSARAVGGAVGRNPISILIPCHRVLGANGTLTGYAGGLRRKEALLQLEAKK